MNPATTGISADNVRLCMEQLPAHIRCIAQSWESGAVDLGDYVAGLCESFLDQHYARTAPSIARRRLLVEVTTRSSLPLCLEVSLIRVFREGLRVHTVKRLATLGDVSAITMSRAWGGLGAPARLPDLLKAHSLLVACESIEDYAALRRVSAASRRTLERNARVIVDADLKTLAADPGRISDWIASQLNHKNAHGRAI